MKALSKRGINVGDSVEIVALGKKFEGKIMPRIEAGDANAIILKLGSGYNVGVKMEHCQSIRKIGEPEKEIVAEKRLVGFDGSKPSVALVATGGTISTRVDYKTGGVFMTLQPEEILRTAPQLAGIVNIASIDSPFIIASEDMHPREWGVIAETVARRLNDGARGAIVTHGTDTLHYTAAALSFMLTKLSKPVALVGAQRSPDRASFDGKMNLLCAASYSASDIAGVAVVMHGSSSDDYCFAHAGTKVRKMHTSRRDAFKSINAKPLAKIWGDGRMEKIGECRQAEWGKTEVDVRFEKKVALVKAYPGAGPEIIDFFVQKKFKGIVVEGTGLGHVPTETLDKKNSWLPAVRQAVDEGVFVAVASQCINGRVNPFVYRNLRLLAGAGAVHCDDMLSETAYVKLGCALAREKNEEKVREFLLTNVAGEFNESITQQT